jgi:hypothetical protein
MKTCTQCGKSKDEMEFYANSKMASGRLNQCKVCTKAANKARYDSPAGKAISDRASARWRQRNKEHGRLASLDLQKNHQQKYIARYQLGNAIKLGKILRKPCERCGSPKSDGHHEDYGKPLEVMWLCRKHHAQRHKELDAIRTALAASAPADSSSSLDPSRSESHAAILNRE